MIGRAQRGRLVQVVEVGQHTGYLALETLKNVGSQVQTATQPSAAQTLAQCCGDSLHGTPMPIREECTHGVDSGYPDSLPTLPPLRIRREWVVSIPNSQEISGLCEVRRVDGVVALAEGALPGERDMEGIGGGEVDEGEEWEEGDEEHY